jgi:hypothetical protein
MRVARARVAVVPAAMRQLPRQSRTAMTILKEQGVGALARRVQEKLRGRGYVAPRVRRSWSAETSIAPLAFGPAEHPRVTIVIPATGSRSRPTPASRACTRRCRTTRSR